MRGKADLVWDDICSRNHDQTRDEDIADLLILELQIECDVPGADRNVRGIEEMRICVAGASTSTRASRQSESTHICRKSG